MNFLLDQDVYEDTTKYLQNLGYKIIRVRDIGLERSSDEELLAYAKRKKLILVTRDKDFGALVFLKLKQHSGVIFLRIDPFLCDIVHKELALILTKHKPEEFENSFVVVEPGRHRFRKSL